jgi:hypothetical protein
MKIVLGNFNAKVGREDTFKQIIWNESLHEINVNKKSRCKKEQYSYTATFINIPGCLQMGNPTD